MGQLKPERLVCMHPVVLSPWEEESHQGMPATQHCPEAKSNPATCLSQGQQSSCTTAGKTAARVGVCSFHCTLVVSTTGATWVQDSCVYSQNHMQKNSCVWCCFGDHNLWEICTAVPVRRIQVLLGSHWVMCMTLLYYNNRTEKNANEQL